MARKKQKKSSSIFGVLTVELLGIVGFTILFIQARAERQQEAGLEQKGFPVIQEMFEQTPFQGILVNNDVAPVSTGRNWNARTFFSLD